MFQWLVLHLMILTARAAHQMNQVSLQITRNDLMTYRLECKGRFSIAPNTSINKFTFFKDGEVYAVSYKQRYREADGEGHRPGVSVLDSVTEVGHHPSFAGNYSCMITTADGQNYTSTLEELFVHPGNDLAGRLAFLPCWHRRLDFLA